MFESSYYPTLITTEHIISLLGFSQSDHVTKQLGSLPTVQPITRKDFTAREPSKGAIAKMTE